MGIRDRKVINLRQKKTSRPLIIAVAIGAIVGIGLVVAPNAYEIKINGEVIGAIKDKKVIEAAKETVITQLEGTYQSEVRFEEDLELRRYKAKKRDYIDPTYLISAMRNDMQILIGFKEIFIEDKSVGIVSSEDELEELKQQLEIRYYGKDIPNSEFGKEIELKEVFAKESDLISIDNLVKKCSVTTPKTIEYEVKAGDSLSAIASKYNTTVEMIIAANPEFGDSPTIVIGENIKVNINEPLLPVNIIQELPKEEKSMEAVEEGEQKEG